MTLQQFFDVLAVGAVVHIGTEHGQGWLFSGAPGEAAQRVPDLLIRDVTHIYPHEGREASVYCTRLDPGLAVMVEGFENGPI